MRYLKVLSIIIMGVSLFIAGCGGGGGGGDTGGSVNLSGNWSGTWDSTVDDYSGTLSASITQSGNTLSGSVTLYGSPCLTSGTVSGSVSDNNVAFGVVSGETTVNFSGTFTESTMSGAYSIDSGSCSGAEGTFSVTKEDGGDTEAPTTPTNLTATAVSSLQIDLSWDASTDNVGVTGYKIYRDGKELAASSLNSSLIYKKATVNETDDTEVGDIKIYRDGNSVTYIETSSVTPMAITDTNYSDTGLNANTQYCYKVSAYDAAGNESEQSGQACATTNEETPQCEGGGLPLNISDLDFPNSVICDTFVEGSVAYEGSFNDIANPIMGYRIYTSGGTITTYILSAPTVDNCRINFTVSIPNNVQGTATSYFKLVDYISGADNWDNNAVSNMLSKPVTINCP